MDKSTKGSGRLLDNSTSSSSEPTSARVRIDCEDVEENEGREEKEVTFLEGKEEIGSPDGKVAGNVDEEGELAEDEEQEKAVSEDDRARGN